LANEQNEKFEKHLKLSMEGLMKIWITGLVAYLQLADIVSRPLLCRLNDPNQPVISTPIVFSTSRPSLLACI